MMMCLFECILKLRCNGQNCAVTLMHPDLIMYVPFDILDNFNMGYYNKHVKRLMFSLKKVHLKM
jgi:hypothetical protein